MHTNSVIDNDIEMSDIPKIVNNYMSFCKQKCICISGQDDTYIPCYNAMVVSAQKPLESFIAFCRNVEPNDPFTTRITWRETTNRLNQYVTDSSISEDEYMRVIRQIRMTIRDSLGEKGYKSYLNIILNSGTKQGRFIQELLQNADDCSYAPNVTPTFTLSIQGKTVITEYNETSFTRANIRSITAIGESTKNSLLSPSKASIGEKGVGFKTIFAVASKVAIHSGNYHFSLSSIEPTIPKIIDKATTKTVFGTRMEITLDENKEFPIYGEKEILELCLCLRNLKQLTIGKHNITITDTDNTRTITIGNHKSVFKRFKHTFSIRDTTALEERKNDNREVSAEQQIVCYVPVSSQAEFPLYCGLPTKHRIRVPIAIDAPFALTTSREEVETDGSAWNNIIRKEMYTSLLKVIDSLKVSEESKVFRFLKFIPRWQGNIRVYINSIFDNRYLNDYDLLRELCSKEIIPTYKDGVFAMPKQNRLYRFPKQVVYIFNNLKLPTYGNIKASSIINMGDNDYESVLNALGCEYADVSIVMPIILRYAEQFIEEEDFRNALYDYLKDNEKYEEIRNLKIIPVYGAVPDSTVYISWKCGKIFVKPNVYQSQKSYYILNEKLMQKDICEKIYSENINEMSNEYESIMYNKNLENFISHESDVSSIYTHLMREYYSGSLKKNDSFKMLLSPIYKIPLKNQRNVITCNRLFICDKPNYFITNMIKNIVVNKECEGLAKEIGITSLRSIYYNDIQYHNELTADDIETLTDMDNNDYYFVNYEEILKGFYRDELISEELLQEYNLEYIAYGKYIEDANLLEFPSEPVKNRKFLASHIHEQWKHPSRIVSIKEIHKVQKIKTNDGKLYSYDRKISRDYIISMYSSEEEHSVCFCQMCKTPKERVYIEVNSIETSPKYFFNQLSVALCLECSKRFEVLRRKSSIRDKFFKGIDSAVIRNEGTIEIPLYDKDTITFTATHLAEIQEILKQYPKNR